MEEFPEEISQLLDSLEAPQILKRHLYIVYETACKIIHAIETEWERLQINKKEVLFGAAPHDIGKILEVNEIYEKGNRHELAGETLLLSHGFSAEFARFARTHGNYQEKGLKVEDLLVILADKIWKGKRINFLEEHISEIISLQLNIDFWEVNIRLDSIISAIITNASQKLNYQRFNNGLD